MKHTLETKNQFIELRAQGLALDAISEQIGVPKATLGRWNLECLDQIQRLRAIQWELVEDQMGQRFEDSLKRIAQRIRRLEDELDTRKPHHFPRMELVRVIRQSRLEYLKLRSILMAPLQPTRRRTPCLGDLDPQKRDKTVQNTDSLDTTSLQQNDLQQSEPVLSHSSTAHGVPASAGQTPADSNDSNSCEAPPQAVPSPGGEGQGEGGIPVPPIAPTEGNRTEPNDHNSDDSHDSQTPSTAKAVPVIPKSTGDLDLDEFYAGESIPLNPYDSTCEFLARTGIQNPASFEPCKAPSPKEQSARL